MSDILQEIASYLYKGDEKMVAELVQAALDQDVNVNEILSDGLMRGMEDVGRDFKAGEIYVPEVLVAARAMHAGMNILRPLLVDTDVNSMGKYLIGTVAGDLHDIGKNLVVIMLEGAGFDVIDLGVDVQSDDFVNAVRQHKPKILGLSALLTTTMVQMGTTIEALEAAEIRDSVRIMVGGAPVTADFAEKIGADGYAPDAASAIDVARELIG